MKLNDLNFIITLDPECDLSINECKKNNIIPLQTNYIIDYKVVNSLCNNDEYKLYYKKIRSGSNFLKEEVNAYAYLSLWHKMINLNKPIIHICSSLKERNYEQAILASKTIKEQYPDINISVIDSKSIYFGCSVLALYASSLREKGKTYSEVVNWLEEYKLSINAVFASSFNSIKPIKKKRILKQIASGKFEEVNNTYLHHKLEHLMTKELSENILNPAEQTLYICSYDSKKAEVCTEQIRKKFGFKEVFYSQMNPSTASKFSAETFGLFFFGKKRV